MLSDLDARTRAAGTVPGDRLAEALAVLVVDLVGVLPVDDRNAALEQLANRLDDQSRAGAGEAASLLAGVSAALMRLEA